jgi:Ca2+-dependent lipid-binding protein
MLRVQVWDDDALSDDMIGEGNLNLTQLYQNPYRTENGTFFLILEYIDLIHRGKSAGRVLISL